MTEHTDRMALLQRTIAADLEALGDAPGAGLALAYIQRYQRIIDGWPYTMPPYAMRDMVERAGVLPVQPWPTRPRR